MWNKHKIKFKLTYKSNINDAFIIKSKLIMKDYYFFFK